MASSFLGIIIMAFTFHLHWFWWKPRQQSAAMGAWPCSMPLILQTTGMPHAFLVPRVPFITARTRAALRDISRCARLVAKKCISLRHATMHTPLIVEKVMPLGLNAKKIFMLSCWVTDGHYQPVVTGLFQSYTPKCKTAHYFISRDFRHG